MRVFAAAIIDRALHDWHKAISQLQVNPDYQHAQNTKREIEEFFSSWWFESLCEINPDFTRIPVQEMMQ